MKMSLSPVIILLFVFNAMGIPLQNQSVILERVERYLEEKEPAWKLYRKEDVKHGRVFDWQSGKQRISVSIRTFTSADEARTDLRNTMMKVTAPPKSEIKSLGDEAFLYQSEGTNRCMLLIRRGTNLIQVNADEFAQAEKFSKHIISLANSL
jgi:hypothetical protein